MNAFDPPTGTVEEWNAAYYRLEDYLRAHHVTYKVHQSQIILRVLQRAAAQHALHPDQAPTKLALEEAYAVMDQWFGRLLPDEPESRASIIGRVSMSIIDATDRWPNVFLASEREIPTAFRTALSDVTLQSGPDLRVSSMVPRPLDSSPVAELIEESWERLGRMSLALLIGILGLFAAGAFFYFTR
jgi:hypothetical protein